MFCDVLLLNRELFIRELFILAAISIRCSDVRVRALRDKRFGSFVLLEIEREHNRFVSIKLGLFLNTWFYTVINTSLELML